MNLKDSSAFVGGVLWQKAVFNNSYNLLSLQEVMSKG